MGLCNKFAHCFIYLIAEEVVSLVIQVNSKARLLSRPPEVAGEGTGVPFVTSAQPHTPGEPWHCVGHYLEWSDKIRECVASIQSDSNTIPDCNLWYFFVQEYRTEVTDVGFYLISVSQKRGTERVLSVVKADKQNLGCDSSGGILAWLSSLIKTLFILKLGFLF